MSDKDILLQLKQLKNIKPDSSWKGNGRSVLLNQISGFGVEGGEEGFFSRFYNSLPLQVMRTASQPALMIFAMMGILVGGSLGLQKAQETKPGDSLYVAKIAGEQTKRVLTFDDKKKIKLEIEFAKNRAEELNDILSEDVQDQAKVEKAVTNFNNSMVAIKTKLEAMGNTSVEERNDNVVSGEDKGKELGQVGDEDEDFVFSANSEKDKVGMEITDKKNESRATSTDIKKETGEAAVKAGSVLDEVKKLLEGEDYADTIDRLKEVEDIVTNITASEKASSTESIDE